MKLETESATLKDEVPREVSMTEPPIEEHCHKAIYDTLISHSNTIHDDDAPQIDKLVAQTYAWSEKVIPLVIDDDPFLKKPSDSPKLILKP